MFKIFFFFIVAKTVAANNTLTIVTMAGSQGVPGAWIGCIAVRLNGKWNGIPWGHLSACWASAGGSPWHEAIPSAVLSGGDVQRKGQSQLVAFLPLRLMHSAWIQSMPCLSLWWPAQFPAPWSRQRDHSHILGPSAAHGLWLMFLILCSPYLR